MADEWAHSVVFVVACMVVGTAAIGEFDCVLAGGRWADTSCDLSASKAVSTPYQCAVAQGKWTGSRCDISTAASSGQPGAKVICGYDDDDDLCALTGDPGQVIDCDTENCFCDVQLKIYPLEPYVTVQPINISLARPTVERVDCPLLAAVYNYMESKVDSSASHQRAIPSTYGTQIDLCVVDNPEDLVQSMKDNVIGLLLNGKSTAVEEVESEENLIVVKKLFRSQVQVIYSPLRLTNNLPFLYKFAINHLLWNFLFLVIQVIIVGGLMWLIERGRPNSDFPDHWARGLQHGWYWAIMTWTTVGYGDDVPRTMYGRIVAVIWAISAVLQIALMTSLIVNDLNAYSSANPTEMLRTASPAAIIGALGNTTSAGHASFYTNAGVSGVRLFSTIDAACHAVLTNNVQAFIGDVNVLNMCFVKWDAMGMSSNLVLGELEAAQQEEYVALFRNASTEVINVVLNSFVPAENGIDVNVNNNGNAGPIVARQWNPSFQGVAPPDPQSLVSWSPILIAIMGALIGLTIMGVAVPLLVCNLVARRTKHGVRLQSSFNSNMLNSKESLKDTLIRKGLAINTDDDTGSGDAIVVQRLLDTQRIELDELLERHQKELDAHLARTTESQL